MADNQEVRHPDFAGLRLVPDPIGGAVITQNCDLFKNGQLDSRAGVRHANHRRYNGGVVAIIDIQRICDYGKILVCSGWEADPDTEVFEHQEGVAPGWGGPVGQPSGGGDGFWDKGFPPVALALAAPDLGLPPLAVQFTGDGSFDPDGGPITYEWNFGDGSPPEFVPNPQHIYAGNQVFTASLTVTDIEGKFDIAGVDIDTRDVVLVRDANNAQVSVDGGVTMGAVAGIPANNHRHIFGANGFTFIFRANGANVDVYRSTDGSNYALVSTFAGTTIDTGKPFLGHNARILIPIIVAGPLTGIAYSDDNGATWTVITVVAGAGTAGSACRMTTANNLMYMRQVAGAYEFYLSVDNGATWAVTLGAFGNGVQVPAITGGQGNRVIAAGSDVANSEIRTSDDLGATWQLRESIAGAPGPSEAWSNGTAESLVAFGAAGNNLRTSTNNGTAWAASAFAGGVFLTNMIQRPDGYFAAGFAGLYFANVLPNFALRGGGGTWWRGVATLRGQEV